MAWMVEIFSLRRVHSPSRKQGKRECAAEQDPHAGPEQAGFDRVADHEETAERERQAAEPHHPAGANALLEAGLGLR